MAARLITSYHGVMMVSPRDLQVLNLALRFGQLTSGHIMTLEFDGLSERSCYNVLRRLVENSYLGRVERRGIGGWKGGSGQWVYCLGPKGYQLLGIDTADRKRWSVMNEHALGIADVYVALVRAEREHHVTIRKVSIDKEAPVVVDTVTVIPDLAVRLEFLAKGVTGRLFVEVDTGTESRSKIEEKMRHYYYMYRNWPHPTFPMVIFLATRPEALQGLKNKVAQAPPEAAPLFMVAELTDFPQLLY